MPVATAEVTTRLRYPEYGPDPIGDELVFVGDVEVGGTYATVYDPDGTTREGWASWGAAGWSGGHRTRQAAQQVQVDAYLADPEGYQRRHAAYLAEKAAEQAARDAADQAAREEREERRRIEREGTDGPGPVVFTVLAYHALYGPLGEVDAVSAWLTANGVDDASAVHDIHVEARAERHAIVYQAAEPWATHRGAPTHARAVTMTVPPPDLTTGPRPDLHRIVDEHWPSRFPLIDDQAIACSCCTAARGSGGIVPWPCPSLSAAIAGGR